MQTRNYPWKLFSLNKTVQVEIQFGLLPKDKIPYMRLDFTYQEEKEIEYFPRTGSILNFNRPKIEYLTYDKSFLDFKKNGLEILKIFNDCKIEITEVTENKFTFTNNSFCNEDKLRAIQITGTDEVIKALLIISKFCMENDAGKLIYTSKEIEGLYIKKKEFFDRFSSELDSFKNSLCFINIALIKLKLLADFVDKTLDRFIRSNVSETDDKYNFFLDKAKEITTRFLSIRKLQGFGLNDEELAKRKTEINDYLNKTVFYLRKKCLEHRETGIKGLLLFNWVRYPTSYLELMTIVTENNQFRFDSEYGFQFDNPMQKNIIEFFGSKYINQENNTSLEMIVRPINF